MPYIELQSSLLITRVVTFLRYLAIPNEPEIIILF